MDLQEALDDMDSWFDSEEGKKSVREFLEYLEREEQEKKRLEKKSSLRYADGKKVKIGDLFIDKKAKERFESDPYNYGYHMYVYRINKDETVDLCIDANFAWKLNYMEFDPDNSELVERKVRLYSPLEDLGREE